MSSIDVIFNNTSSSLDIIIASMFAGKTSRLMQILEVFHEAGKKVIYINNILDTREDESNFSTHSNILKMNNIPFPTIKTSRIKDVDVSQYDIIAIDEGNFYGEYLKEDILYLVEQLNKKVIIAGLSGDFTRQPFGQLLDLIPLADNIIKLSSFCKICNDESRGIVKAPFTKKINSNNYTSSNNLEVGAGDLYIPVCRSCYLK